MDQNKFWLEDPCVLVTDFNIIPNAKLTLNEKLNALSRLVLIISGGMYAMEYKYWSTFLLVGILIILVIKVLGDKKIEGFSIPPTYVDGAEPVTTVPPLHAEEWQIPPPIYDEYTNTPDDCEMIPQTDERPVYGQYITSNRLFPYQTQVTHNGTLNDAQLFMNDEFTRDTMQFRNDMTRNYVNKLNRYYRQGCNDPISPWNSC